MRFSLLSLAVFGYGLIGQFANAFPVGVFECGKGQTTSRIEIEKIVVGSASLPRLTVTLRRPDLESNLSGIGLLLQTTDRKTGEIERRLLLPGSNLDLKYTENDELQLMNSLSNSGKVCDRRR